MEEIIKNTFNNAKIFWVFFGSMITAVGLIYAIFFKDVLNQKREIKNIKKGLELEIITNINTLFSKEVERPSLFNSVTMIRTRYAQHIKNQDIFWKIQKLYVDLEYYKVCVNNFYLKREHGGVLTTEKQLQTCNTFLEYFGENPIEYDLSYREEWNKKNSGREYIDSRRDKAIDVKNRKIDWWKRKIRNDINLMFK